MVDEHALRRALEATLEAVVVGAPSSPATAARAKAAARAVLLRSGLRRARVEVRRQGAGVAVVLTLPPGATRVRQVVVGVGALPW